MSTYEKVIIIDAFLTHYREYHHIYYDNKLEIQAIKDKMQLHFIQSFTKNCC